MSNFSGLFPNNALADCALSLIFATPGMNQEWYAEQCERLLNGLCTHTGEVQAHRIGARVFASTLTRSPRGFDRLVFDNGQAV
jgi:pimeloyl-ACP methyl ester carboxylesterase